MATGKLSEVFRYKGFTSFLITQFLGALNDNFYKFVLAMLILDKSASSEEMAAYLAKVTLIFVFPFVMFSGYAGYVADRFKKRNILILAKCFEIVVMSLAFTAFYTDDPRIMLGVLFMMATQSTFFSPAKYGILPEILPDKHLTRANSLVELTTFVAIIAGGAMGGILLDTFAEQMWVIGIIVVGIALVGTAASFGITRVPSSGATRPFKANPWSEAWAGLKGLYGNKPLFLTVLGISYFWLLGVLFQMTKNLLGKDIMHLSNTQIGLLWSFLAIGIGAGSLAAARLSGDKVEQGLVPIGSIGLGVFAIALSQATGGFNQAALALVLLGFSGGIFIVPLNALLQQKAGTKEKGRYIAASNILNSLAMILASGLMMLMGSRMHMGADEILMVAGVMTFIVTGYIFTRIPDFFIRFLLWLLTHTLYKVRIMGGENVPFRGPALLVANHVSHVDGLIIASCIQRFVRFIVYAPFYRQKRFNWLFKMMNAIPVSEFERRSMVEALVKAREELKAGHVVCIFAEGAVTRSGNMLKFKRGFEKIAGGLDVPIIPVHLDRLWGSIFSFERGKFFRKVPRQVPYPVTVTFGKHLAADAKTYDVRQAIMALGSEAAAYRQKKLDFLHLAFIEQAKKTPFALALADSTGVELPYWRALVGSIALGRWVKRRCRDEEKVGIMLPASVGGALANIAVTMRGKIPVNLNFTAGVESLDSAIEQCGIKTILSSRIFIARAKIEERKEMVFLEDVMKEVTAADKFAGFYQTFLVPALLLRRLYKPKGKEPNDLATIIFSSGSTGMPKGVMLSHHNILSNIESMSQIFWVSGSDGLMGVLPFFHSFGFTVSLWFPLVTGARAIFHANPMDAGTIGKMVDKYKATILMSTPTFCTSYTRKCSSEEFSSLRYVMVGAEKLKTSIAEQFREKFSFPLLEGYGCTEMSPAVAVNIMNVEHRHVADGARDDGRTERHTGYKAGTVGHPVPGVAVKVVDQKSGETLPPQEEGLLLARGPNRMLGYLGQPEKTAEVFRNGWYVTGDIAKIDEDGFITIVDRISRFSKIAGEMVPHGRVEESVQECLGDGACAVTGLSDEQRGEKLVVLYADKDIEPKQLHEKLAASSLAKLWIPRPDNIHRVEEIPVLGTGKLDLKKVKELAQSFEK